MAKGEVKDFYDEVQAQIAENNKKNAKYFADMEEGIKRNNDAISNAQALLRRDEAVWKQCGIDINTYDGKNNPFLMLEKIAPEGFPKMSEWAERSRQEAIKELEFFGYNYQEIQKAKANRKIMQGSNKAAVSAEAVKKSQSKKRVRRVRI